MILSLANFSMSCLVPELSNLTVAFLLAPAPSREMMVPSPNFWWSTLKPSWSRSGLKASKEPDVAAGCGEGVLLVALTFLNLAQSAVQKTVAQSWQRVGLLGFGDDCL